MKKIWILFLGVTLMSLPSCFELDNWDAPDCTFHGTVYDSYTGKPILSSQNDWQFRIWERSWTGHVGGAVTHQELRIKQDGTYQNTKLFAGTYDMLPYNGPYWPVDTLKNVVLKGKTEQNFTVTPYVQIVDFTCTFDPTTPTPHLIFKCKVKAPIFEKDGVALPNLYWVKAFISRTIWCGQGENSYIGEYLDADCRKQPNQPWDKVISEQITGTTNRGNGVDTSGEFYIGPLPVKSGYTYWVRMGAAVNDTHRKYNYSEILVIPVP